MVSFHFGILAPNEEDVNILFHVSIGREAMLYYVMLEVLDYGIWFGVSLE